MKKSTITMCSLAVISASNASAVTPNRNTYLHLNLHLVDSHPAEGIAISKTIGYDFTDYFSLEATYSYPALKNENILIKDQLTPEKGKVPERLDWYGEFKAVNITPVYKYHISDKVDLLARAGLALVQSELRDTHTNCNDAKTKHTVQDSSFGVIVGLGVEWTFEECEFVAVYARAEYNYLSLGQIEQLNTYTGISTHDLGGAHVYSFAVGLRF
ncbi:outer membrane protein [Vibrio coralliilyticus]|uniref:outer membrane protein n=1 Tax=Vibrio coralliilyticus TaxID=190893 RepID=UPI00148CA532|nr:outer membrane beta-barrel protein [Vibrio coralliilyticus]NOI27141.1 porin family protein [Vibrio coralliilyticus]NOI46568.1 porin family protein [Vibrio coralliilyticus]